MTLDLKTSWYRVSFQVLCVGSSALLNQQNNDFNACKSRLRELKREKLFLHPSLYTIYLEYVGFKIVGLQVSKKYKSKDSKVRFELLRKKYYTETDFGF